jgi:hypothetical protein
MLCSQLRLTLWIPFLDNGLFHLMIIPPCILLITALVLTTTEQTEYAVKVCSKQDCAIKKHLCDNNIVGAASFEHQSHLNSERIPVALAEHEQ